MVFPLSSIDSPLAVTDGNDLADERQRMEIVTAEIAFLNASLVEYDKFRAYYDGSQKLVFGTEKLKSEFGDAFKDYKDNWCEVVVGAVADRLEIEGILAGEVEESIGNGDQGDQSDQGDQVDLSPSSRVWDIFRDNDIDSQQADVHEGALVEGRSYVIVWPDDDLGARIDWNPAQLVRVRYSDDDWRLPVLAIKRWVTPAGDIRVNVYTPAFVYKYHQSREQGTPKPLLEGVRATIPTTILQTSLIARVVPNEPWPLPNPFGAIPIVEFANRNGSELRNVIAQQDALNYLMVSSLGATGFQAFPQRVLFTDVKEPAGGWANSPGRVWKVPPTLDPDGKPVFGSMGEFSAFDLSGFRQMVEMQLQHIALTSKTPVRMFFQSDRGGRGDAPSGDSLLVDDEPLLDKVEMRQTRFGNSWIRVAKLVAQVTNIALPRGEMRWKDPRAKYRSSLLEEAVNMKKVGIPTKFIIRTLSFTPDEERLLNDMLDQEEKKLEEQARLEQQMAVTAVTQKTQGTQPAQPTQSTQSSSTPTS